MTTGDARTDRRGSLLRPFRNRNFRLIWAGQTVSNIGDSMYNVAFAWAVYQLTGSPADMGLVLLLNMIPRLVLTVFGGALADRLSRRLIVLVGDVVAGLVVAALALASYLDATSTAMFAAAAFCLGLVTAFFDPAYRPLYRNILDVEDQQAAAAVVSSTQNATQIAGPLLAGLLFATGGATVSFAVNAATFLFSAACTAFVAIPKGSVGYSGTLFQDVRSGLRYVTRTGWLRTTLLLSLLANFVALAPLHVLLPAVVKDAGGGSRTLGVAVALQAVTAGLFTLLVGKYGHRVPRGVAIYTLIAAMGVGVAVLSDGKTYPALIMAAMVLTGIGFSFNTVEVTMLQELIPEHYLSRVYSIAVITSLALMPIGYAVVGVLAQVIGVGTVLLVGGGALAVVTAGVALISRGRLSDQNVNALPATVIETDEVLAQVATES